MRLTVPEPKIKLYEQGFEDRGDDGKELDRLNRKPTGDKLSKLVEDIDDPLVIALDGAWGSGKSFFLKFWVGEHKNHNAETKTVYFDAFQHDFLDDPLIALTSAIATRFEKDEKHTPTDSKAKTGKIKKVAWLLGKSGLKIGASLATFGATNHLEELGDAVVTAAGDEAKALLDSTIGDAESESFWASQRAKIAAMDAFKQALVELTEPATEEDVKKALSTGKDLKKGGPTRKLVIVIDELDRCRPDYALSLLEIIKHFFNVDGVHFVLGVNLTELQNSVKARYGSEINAPKYLQKFVSLGMPLRSGIPRTSNYNDYIKHFQNTAEKLQATQTWQYDFLSDYLGMVDHHIGISLRDVEKILGLSLASPLPTGTADTSLQVFAGLAIIKIVKPHWIELARFGDLSFQQVSTLFKFPAPFRTSAGPSTGMSEAEFIWRSSLKYDPNWVTPTDNDQRRQASFGDKEPRKVLRNIIANSLDVFVLPE